MRRVLAVIGGTMLGLVPALGLLATPAAALTFTADILTDENDGVCTPGDCSLREAMGAASTSPGADDVVLGATGTYSLTLGALTSASADPITVQGNGNTVNQTVGSAEVFNLPGPITLVSIITTGGDHQVFSAGAVTVTGSSLTSAGGNGINAAGVVTVTSSVISGETGINNGNTVSVTGSQITGTIGDGISSSNAVTVTDSTVTGGDDGISNGGNTTVTRSTVTGGAGGDGISASGVVTVTDSTITGGDGGISNGDDTTVTRSLITGGTGAGVSNDGDSNIIQSTITDSDLGVSASGEVTITNSTITGNGDSAASAQFVTLIYATITDNGGAESSPQISAQVLTSFGSVVALPAGPANCDISSTITEGYNYSDDDTCEFTDTANGDVENGADPQLGALADNGGPTPTRLPAATSPLVDAIPAAACQDDGAAGITTDQRGLPRPGFVNCDIGAVELQPATAPLLVVRFTG